MNIYQVRNCRAGTAGEVFPIGACFYNDLSDIVSVKIFPNQMCNRILKNSDDKKYVHILGLNPVS